MSGLPQGYLDLVEDAERDRAEGRAEAAREKYARALELRPNSPALLARFAEACLRSGEEGHAADALRRLLELDPLNVRSAVTYTQLASRQKRPDKAPLRRIFGVAGRHVKSLPYRLVGRKAQRGLPVDFVCDPDGLPALARQQVLTARRLIRSLQLDGAAALARRLLEDGSHHPAIFEVAGHAAARQRNHAGALDAFRQAAEGAPGKVALSGHMIAAAARAEQYAEAEKLLASLPPAGRADPTVRFAEAVLHHKSGRSEAAVEIVEKLADEPALAFDAAELAARALSGLGRFDEANRWLDRLAAMNAGAASPFLIAAVNRQLQPGTKLFAQAEATAEDPETAQEQRAIVCFALGMAHKAAKEHDRAMDRLGQGNALVDRAYDPAGEEWHVETVKRVFTPSLLARARDMERGRGMVFVVGMPRSGSTLLAQILASHPAATSVGEAQVIYPCIERATELGYPESAAEIPDSAYEELGRMYLDALPPAARGHEVVVDKELLKFLHLGLVRMMLPGARFVHSRRSPMDVCFSIYGHWFEGAHPYAYRQETIAHFHNMHDRLMAHWHEVMPGQIHEARYEQVIADTEGETRKLLAAVGLSFDPACLDFRASDSSVATSSRYQVRQGIYATAVESWRPYQHRLGPLIASLENAEPEVSAA